MSLRDCMVKKKLAGKVDPALADEAIKYFNQARQGFGGRMSAADADAAAGQATFEHIKAAHSRYKANKLRQALIEIENARILADFRGGEKAGHAVLARLSPLGDEGDFLKYGGDVESRSDTIQRHAQGIAADAMEQIRVRRVGTRPGTAQAWQIVRELAGEASGNVDAKQAAKGLAEASEYLRLRFNRAGGDIPKRKDWIWFQARDPVKVRGQGKKADRDAWVTSQMDDLDLVKMATGGPPIDPAAMIDSLRRIWFEIAESGLKQAKRPHGFTLADTRLDKRNLVYRDAAAWRRQQERWGNPDIVSSVHGWMRSMSRDIARMELLGPNPEEGLEAMIEAAGSRITASQASTARNIDLQQAGELNIPVNATSARAMQGWRNLETAAKLGGAAVSAISDWNWQGMVRGLYGLPAFHAMVVPTVRQLFSSGDRKLAVRLGLGADNWIGAAAQANRFFNEYGDAGTNWTAKVADVSLRASGLTPWTAANRRVTGLAFLEVFGDNAGKAFGELDDKLVRGLQRYGIDEAAWRRIGRNMVDGETGYLDLQALYRSDPDLAQNLHRIIVRETQHAVPTSFARGREWVLQGTRPGTLPGEFMRSLGLFRSFALTNIGLNVARMWDPTLTRADRMRWGARLIIGSAIYGAIALQAKQVMWGRDPLDMTDPHFAWAAFAQGGGAGIMADLIMVGTTRRGHGWWAGVLGPQAATVAEVKQLTVDNLIQAIEGKDTGFLHEAQRTATGLIPGSTTWYARVALERMVFDEMARAIDPQAQRRFSRAERWWRRERGQRFWWGRGDTLPGRAPDMGAAAP